MFVEDKQELQDYLREEFGKPANKYLKKEFKNRISKDLERYLDCGLSEVALDPKIAGYDLAFCLNYTPKGAIKKKNALFVVGLNTKTQEMQAIVLASKTALRAQDNPERIAEILHENNVTPFHLYDTQKKGFKFQAKLSFMSLEDLGHAIKKRNKYLINRLHKEIGYSRSGKSKKKLPKGSSIFYRIEHDMHDFLEETRAELLETLINYAGDPQALAWAEEICENFGIKTDYDEFDFYNLIVRAKTEDLRGYRYTALKQFSALGIVPETDQVWDDIDAGIAPAVALAREFDVKPHTIKHMIRRSPLFKSHEHAVNYARLLDRVDLYYWPKDEADLRFFQIFMADMDQTCEFMDFDPYKWTADCVAKHKKNVKQDLGPMWLAFCFYQMQDSIQKFLSDSYEIHKISNRDFRRHHTSPNYNANPQKSTDLHPYLIKQDKFWTEINKESLKMLKEINDMKDDLSKRLFLPACILELAKNNIKLLNPEVLDDLIDEIKKNIWQDSSPSEQIWSNKYWHSPNININARFRSASMNEQQASWPALLGDEPYKLKSGLYVHPLNSQKALDEEAEAMKTANRGFCIDSYGSYFFTSNYHMMSIRDERGNRLCSVTLKDFLNKKENQRHVKHNQNKGPGNTDPSTEGTIAENRIIQLVNTKQIKIDWTTIDAARAEYKINQVENAAGYDFKDFERRNAVFKIYKPCLPKEKVKKGHDSFDGFMRVIGLPTLIDKFLEEHDFSQGGISILKQKDTKPANQNGIIQSISEQGVHYE